MSGHPMELMGESATSDRSFAIRLMEHLVVPTFVIDHDRRVLVWNRACERLTGIMAQEMVGTSDHWRGFYQEPRPCLADLVALGDYDSIKSLYAAWDSFGLSDFGVSAENWCLMPRAGRKRYLAIDAGPIYDETGRLIAVVETMRDMTVQHEAKCSLQSLAAEDSLTGLPNRRSFDEGLEMEIRCAAMEGRPLSLLMIDVDCFKSFNDTYGHQNGDACLKAVAKTMAQSLHRAGDRAARYGGEEFAVILPNTDGEAAWMIAERIRSSVEQLGIRHSASTGGDVVTLSIGIATGIGQELDANRLISAADGALYASKQDGRNRSRSADLEETLVLF